MENQAEGGQPYLLTFEKIGNPESGFLTTTQQAANLPFAVRRIFWIYDTPENVKRAQHANKKNEEIMVAVSGKVKVNTETLQGHQQTFELQDPETGLYIPAWCWLTVQPEPGAVLLCLSSADFDPADYINDLEVFRNQRPA